MKQMFLIVFTHYILFLIVENQYFKNFEEPYLAAKKGSRFLIFIIRIKFVFSDRNSKVISIRRLCKKVHLNLSSCQNLLLYIHTYIRLGIPTQFLYINRQKQRKLLFRMFSLCRQIRRGTAKKKNEKCSTFRIKYAKRLFAAFITSEYITNQYIDPAKK